MCRFIESIRWENGQFHLLKYHQSRLEKTMGQYFPQAPLIDLEAHLKPPKEKGRLQKVRVIYAEKIEELSIEPYIRKIPKGIKIITSDEISYAHKYENRELLSKLFDQRGNDSDILIVKNDLVTDTHYANIVFFDGLNWITPKSNLLAGVQRSYLIDQGIIEEGIISITDIKKYSGFKLINAMNPWASSPVLLTSMLRTKR